MKIVKMHEGSREAFDDFLEQRLNELELDNDLADKYFAKMNLPVPVIPAPARSFFSMHKNKLGLLVLLLSIVVISFTIFNTTTKVDSKNTTSIDVLLNDKQNVAKTNDAISNNTFNVKTESKHKDEENEKDLTINNVTKPSKADKDVLNKDNSKTNNFVSNKNKVRDNTYISTKNNVYKKIELKKANTFVSAKNDKINFNKDSFKLNSNNLVEKTSVFKLNNNTQNAEVKSNKTLEKLEVEKADSLYIVW